AEQRAERLPASRSRASAVFLPKERRRRARRRIAEGDRARPARDLLLLDRTLLRVPGMAAGVAPRRVGEGRVSLPRAPRPRPRAQVGAGLPPQLRAPVPARGRRVAARDGTPRALAPEVRGGDRGGD